VYRTALIGTTN